MNYNVHPEIHLFKAVMQEPGNTFPQSVISQTSVAINFVDKDGMGRSSLEEWPKHRQHFLREKWKRMLVVWLRVWKHQEFAECKD